MSSSTGWAEKARTARRRARSQRGRRHIGGQSSSAQPNVACGISASGCSRPGTPALRPGFMGAFADRDQVSCAYDAEATVSAVAGRMAQAGFAGDRLRDACLDICDALAASSAPLAVGILRAFAVAGPDSAVRDHAGTLADAAGRTAPAWAAELGQAIPGKCWTGTSGSRGCRGYAEHCVPPGLRRRRGCWPPAPGAGWATSCGCGPSPRGPGAASRSLEMLSSPLVRLLEAVGAENLCHQTILMNHAASAVTSLNPEPVKVGDVAGQRAQRRGLLQARCGRWLLKKSS